MNRFFSFLTLAFVTVTFVCSAAAQDTTPPVLSGGLPSGAVSTSKPAVLSVTTNEASTCKYDANAGVQYGSMASSFSSDDGLQHRASLFIPEHNHRYFYFVKCRDARGNVTASDHVLGFTGMTVSPSELLSADRRIDWSLSGVPGGIPNRTAICADVTKSPYFASGSIVTTTGSISAGSADLTVTNLADFKVGEGVAIPGESEVAVLTLTSGAAASGSITLTFDGKSQDVAVTAGETAVQIADKLRGVYYFSGGMISGGAYSTAKVTFTGGTPGNKIDGTFSGNATGVTGSVATTVQGRAELVSTIKAIAGSTLTLNTTAKELLAQQMVVHDDSHAIQAAINTCPDDGVVFLPRGNYNLVRALIMQPVLSSIPPTKKITVRGAGMKQTTLYGALSTGGQALINVTGGNASSRQNLKSGYSKLSTSIETTSASSIRKGMMARISQTDEADLVFNVGGYQNNLGQLVYVTKVNGNTLEFDPPLFWDFKQSQIPTLQYYPYVNERIGFEDFTITHTNGKAADSMAIDSCYGCWIKNVESSNTPSMHVLVTNSLRGEIRDTFIHDQLGSGPNHSGIIFYTNVNGFLVENNIVVRVSPSLEINGSSNGNVFSYNYSDESVNPSFIAVDFDTNHGPHNIMNLWEGNRAIMFQSDGYFGSASHTTAFRNWFTGTHPTLIDNRQAVSLKRWSYYFSMIGNVLGVPGFGNPRAPGLYEIELPYTYGQPVIYQLGFPNVGNNSFNKTTSPPMSNLVSGGPSGNQARDLNVPATLLRHANYDYVTNGTRWSDAVSLHTLPPSLFRAGKPTWWDQWGATPWPPFGPDVAGLVSELPAQRRYTLIKSQSPSAPGQLRITPSNASP